MTPSEKYSLAAIDTVREALQATNVTGAALSNRGRVPGQAYLEPPRDNRWYTYPDDIVNEALDIADYLNHEYASDTPLITPDQVYKLVDRSDNYQHSVRSLGRLSTMAEKASRMGLLDLCRCAPDFMASMYLAQDLAVNALLGVRITSVYGQYPALYYSPDELGRVRREYPQKVMTNTIFALAVGRMARHKRLLPDLLSTCTFTKGNPNSISTWISDYKSAKSLQ